MESSRRSSRSNGKMARQQGEGEDQKKQEAQLGPDGLAVAGGWRSWDDLPDLPQQIVAGHVKSIPDLISFGAACHGSRSLSKAVPLSSLPPLLLRSFAAPDEVADRDWPRNPKCCIQSVVPGPSGADRLFLAKMNPRLRRRLLGYSFGHLIFAYAKNLYVSNIFTGTDTLITLTTLGWRINPNLINHCVLTAPMGSPSCFLLITTHDCCVLCRPWTYGGGQSYRLQLPAFEGSCTQSVAVANGRVFFMGRTGRISVLDLSPTVSLRWLAVPAPDVLVTELESFNRRLVECDGDVLLVLFAAAAAEILRVRSIHVFRLDIERSAWIPTADIGEWCLFIDAVGTCPIASRDPARWGGRNNCAYVSGPGCETWSVFPVDGSEIDPTGSPLDERFCRRLFWPSAIWAYPSTLY